MTFWLHLMVILTVWEGVHSQIVLTQVGSELKRPGESVQLKCATSGFVVTDYWMNWIRQKAGKGLEWLVMYWKSSATNYYLPAIQGRFTASKDSSNFYLQMNNLSPEDTGVYYCARGSGSYSYPFDHWGPGTLTSITSATSTAPSVFPLISCPEDQSKASQVKIGCLVHGYFPEAVTVQWNSGAITSGIRTFPAALLSSSGLYTLSSQLTIPSARWSSEDFSCTVGHTATSSRITKKVEGQTIEKKSPEVRLLHSSCDPKSSDATMELLCVVSHFYPSTVTVDWLVGGQPGLLASYTEPPRQDPHASTFSTTSTANISLADWKQGNTYYCQVTHEATETKVKSRAKICEGGSSCPSTDISTYIVHPTPKDLYLNRAPKLACVVGNLDSEEGLRVTWSREQHGSLNPGKLEVSEELNGTYTALSKLPISIESWEGEETFTCTVEYPGLAVPITKTIAKMSSGKISAPKVYVFRPHHEELTATSQTRQGQMLSISCLVTSFSPADISVQWLKNDNALPEDNHVNTPVLKNNHRDSSFMYSKLQVPRSDWEEGNTFTCMVVHEGLGAKLIQRTVDNSQGKQ